MWFSKQGDALKFHDAHPDHIVIAKDISRFGHKKYGVFPRSHVDIFQGPYNELIRTNAVCRLYFDLDGGADLLPRADEIVAEVVGQVRAHVGSAGRVIVLCSSTESKFSKHIIFTDVFFENNWEHMKNFVGKNCLHDHIDYSVYTRNRCFRMAGCCKYAEPNRIFRPGCPSSALIAVVPTEGSVVRTCPSPPTTATTAITAGAFDVRQVNLPDAWGLQLRSIEPDELLRVIPSDQPYNAFFSIGCAYKRAGGSLATFCEWCKGRRNPNGVKRQWLGWNKSDKGYGYSFLKEVALRCSKTDECEVHMDEAFGFHPEKYNGATVYRFDQRYLDKSIFRKGCARHQLIKSRTGSGKSTIARWLCQEFVNKRVLYLVSSRTLARAARDSLNKPRLGRTMNFSVYLEDHGPLYKIKHLVCTIQSLWRVEMKKEKYDLVVADEFSSIIEDMTNTTNKHPKKNQDTLRWVAKNCDRFVALDAHLMDTSLELFSDYFTKFEVNINLYRGTGRDAVFIPTPQWTTLKKTRAKACVPNAKPKDTQAFADATCMYDLMFDCWAQNVKTFFVCNNVSLGSWVEENYLRRSFTWMALIWSGLYDTLATLVTDFAFERGYTLKYKWIRKGDNTTSKDFECLDWWGRLDHLQYTLKVCQGIDFNPKQPHYGVGFCYTTPNTAVPRRILQQNGRIRALAKNPIRKRPTVFFALGERVTVKRLQICGVQNLDRFAKKQSYFMEAVVKYHGERPGRLCDWVYEPDPVWRKLYLMVMNERETYLRYPRRSFEYWLRHDNWNISAMQTKPKKMLEWNNCPIRDLVETPYEDIPLLGDLQFEWLRKRRNLTGSQELQIKKHKFLQTFKDENLWNLYCTHPKWVANTLIERFGNFDDVVARRYGKLVCTQKNTEWVDMTAARLVIIQKLTAKLGLTELWNSNGKIISPGVFDRATKFIEENKENIRLAFGFEPTLKTILLSWGGHKLSVHLRIRKREQENGPFPDKHCSVATFVSFMEKTKRDIGEFRRLHNGRLWKKDIRPFLCRLHKAWREKNPSRRVDVSVRKIESPPWNELRYPGVPAERPCEDCF